MTNRSNEPLQETVASLRIELEGIRGLLDARRRHVRRVGLALTLVLGFVVVVAAVKVKGGNLEIWEAGGSNPKSSYEVKLLGTNSIGTQRSILGFVYGDYGFSRWSCFRVY